MDRLFVGVTMICPKYCLTRHYQTSVSQKKTLLCHFIGGCIIVGKDDSVVIKWMKLELGETKKCECGHWFKLVTLAE